MTTPQRLNALLTGRLDLQVFLHLIGPSGTGKSTLERLTVHLMMQEKVALEFSSNPILRDQGLGSRMLAAWPTSTACSSFMSG